MFVLNFYLETAHKGSHFELTSSGIMHPHMHYGKRTAQIVLAAANLWGFIESRWFDSDGNPTKSWGKAWEDNKARKLNQSMGLQDGYRSGESVMDKYRH